MRVCTFCLKECKAYFAIGHFRVPKNLHFQNEAKCETFVVKMSFICIIIENHFPINGFALSLVLKVRFFGTRKWPIEVAFFKEIRHYFSIFLALCENF